MQKNASTAMKIYLLPKNLFIQDLEAPILRENFLISAVVSILTIRFFLKITDYPQVGGDGFHIAHMLWGGLLMLGALILLLSFLSRSSRYVSAIIGGIGFGVFIDELGKFITSDNNYFFQPTIAILYALFVLLYIFSRYLSQRRKITKIEYLINALEMTKDAVLNDLDEEEKKKALIYLRKSNQSDPLVGALTDFLNDIESLPAPPPSIFTRGKRIIYHLYQRVTASELLERVIVAILLGQAGLTIGRIALLIFTRPELSFDEVGRLFSSLLSAFFVLLGVFFFRISHLTAYRLFKVAVLITLLLTQFFIFYQEQFFALIGLGFNILLLLVIDYALDKEDNETR